MFSVVTRLNAFVEHLKLWTHFTVCKLYVKQKTIVGGKKAKPTLRRTEVFLPKRAVWKKVGLFKSPKRVSGLPLHRVREVARPRVRSRRAGPSRAGFGALAGGGPGSGVCAPALPVPAAPSSRPAVGAGTRLGWGPRAGPVRGRGGRRVSLRPRDMTADGQDADAGAGEEPGAAPLPSRVAKLLSALFYGTCSFLLVLVNKALLTTYG